MRRIKKVNNKGFYVFSTLIIVLTICIFLIGVFYISSTHSFVSIKNSNKHIVPYIEEKIALERLHGIFSNNISYSPNNSEINFNDINRFYKLINENTQYEDIVIGPLNSISNQIEKEFEVWNKTDITIELEPKHYEDFKPGYYEVGLFLNDSNETILPENDNQNFNQNTKIFIPANFVYNEAKNKTNYGKYKLIVNSINCDVTAHIHYQRLDNRNIKIIDNNKNEKSLILKRNPYSNSVQIFLKNE